MVKVPHDVARWALAGLFLAAGGLMAGGCSPAVPQDVAVRWLLADGRSCIDAAVLTVTLTATGDGAGGSTVSGDCPASARADARLAVPSLIPGMSLRGLGLSSSDTVLYQGQLTVPDPVPPSLDLTLYFTGGR